jgi:glutamyl-tRNA synthetase
MALHELLYRAFGWKAPRFAHLPLILKPEGKGKLSKRDGDKHGFPVFPIEWKKADESAMGYREEGYLPDALVNMLALLGWNPGTEQEIFTKKELIKLFSLEKVSKSGARFNPEKTIWFNHQYIQKMNDLDILTIYRKILEERNINSNDEFNLKAIELLKERANFISDIYTQGEFFYHSPENYDEKAVKKAWKEDTSIILTEFSNELTNLPKFNHQQIHKAAEEFVEKKSIGFGRLMMPVRLALVGGLHGPDVPVIMEVIGRDETLRRLSLICSKL